MRLEDHVCTRKQAEKLFELGLNFDTLWNWYHRNKWYWVITHKDDCDSKIKGGTLPAYSVAELGILLKDTHDFAFRSFYCNNCDSWAYAIEIGFYSDYPGLEFEESCFKTEAQARAEALIWLLEKKYVKAEDLKL